MKIEFMSAARPIFAAVNNLTMKQSNNLIINKQGFIAFTSLLIISAITLSIIVSISLLGVSEAAASLSFKKGQEAFQIAQSCAEEALLRLRDNAAWDPNASQIPLPGLTGSCIVDIEASANDRTIDITATIPGPPEYVKKLELTAKRVGHSLNIIFWQEVE